MEKIGFIYLWFDRKRKMYYIGCHWGTLDDGYICSSKWMRDAYRYRPEDFKRRIIQTNILRENLTTEEYKWLSLIKSDEIKTRYYNLSLRYFGHWANDLKSHLTVKEKLSAATKALHNDPVYRAKYMEGRKNMPLPSAETIEKRAAGNRGKHRSEETKEKIRISNTGKIKGPLSAETKGKLSAIMTENNVMYRSEVKQNHLSVVQSAEHRQKMSNAVKGSVFWTNGTINKRGPINPGEGWRRGRI